MMLYSRWIQCLSSWRQLIFLLAYPSSRISSWGKLQYVVRFFSGNIRIKDKQCCRDWNLPPLKLNQAGLRPKTYAKLEHPKRRVYVKTKEFVLISTKSSEVVPDKIGLSQKARDSVFVSMEPQWLIVKIVGWVIDR